MAIWEIKTTKKTYGRSKCRSASKEVNPVRVPPKKSLNSLPSRLELASVDRSQVKALHLRQLLSFSFAEKTVTRSMVRVHRKSRPVKHVVPTVLVGEKEHTIVLANRHTIGIEAKRSAIVSLVLKRNPAMLKRRLHKALSNVNDETVEEDSYFPSKAARKKHASSNVWVTFYDSDACKRNAREVVAVAMKKPRQKLWFALVDEHYFSDRMEVIQL